MRMFTVVFGLATIVSLLNAWAYFENTPAFIGWGVSTLGWGCLVGYDLGMAKLNKVKK